jgi:hypothetical protein
MQWHGNSIGGTSSFSERSRHQSSNIVEQTTGLADDEEAPRRSAGNQYEVLEQAGDDCQNQSLLAMDRQYYQQKLKFRSSSSLLLGEGRGQESSLSPPSSCGEMERKGSALPTNGCGYYLGLVSPAMRSDLVAVLLGTMLSWHVPRYLIRNETHIALKEAPYQVLRHSNDVVLDPELNQPWIDSPTIPCTYLQCGTHAPFSFHRFFRARTLPRALRHFPRFALASHPVTTMLRRLTENQSIFGNHKSLRCNIIQPTCLSGHRSEHLFLSCLLLPACAGA